MADITIDWIGAKLSEVLDEMRNMRAELSAMRSEIHGGFHRARGTDDRVEGLRRIVDSHGQRITSLEKVHRPERRRSVRRVNWRRGKSLRSAAT